MKTTDIILIGAVALGALYFKGEILGAFGGDGGNGASTATPSPPAYVPYVPPYVLPAPEPIYTPAPVVPSEPDVSRGLPLDEMLQWCPTLTQAYRYVSDVQVCCQCRTGQVQCGNPASMGELMYGTSAASSAWRGRFCGI